MVAFCSKLGICSHHFVFFWLVFMCFCARSLYGLAYGSLYDLSGWFLYQFHAWQNMPFLSYSCCPLAQDGCCFTVLFTQVSDCIQVSGTQGTGSHCPVGLLVDQFLDVSYPMSFLRARGASQPLPTREPNAHFFSLVKQGKKYKWSVWHFNQISSH